EELRLVVVLRKGGHAVELAVAIVILRPVEVYLCVSCIRNASGYRVPGVSNGTIMEQIPHLPGGKTGLLENLKGCRGIRIGLAVFEEARLDLIEDVHFSPFGIGHFKS